MWPLLLLSVVSLTVVLERLWFIFSSARKRSPDAVTQIFACVERGDYVGAGEMFSATEDFVARVLSYAIAHGRDSVEKALQVQASIELRKFSSRLSVLDTTITLAPLLGLLGTVTGMIHSFGLLGTEELSAPTAITGGIAEALIATACGLGIAILALLPFNFLLSRIELAKKDIEEAGTKLEVLLDHKSSGGRGACEN